ncbi:MAG: potassium transporter TrkA [Aquificae bacterium]|nr:potassium transporter TrkA [Aquificota bacterium]
MRVFLLGMEGPLEELVEELSSYADELVLVGEGVKPLEREGVKVVNAPVTDLSFWRRTELSPDDAVVLLLTPEEALDLTGYLRKVYGFKGLVAVVTDRKVNEKPFRELGAEVISLPALINALLKSLIKGKGLVKYAIGVGLLKGELAEVLVTESSPAAGLRVKDLRQRGARICLLYRGEEVVLPRPQTRIEVSDRLLITGRPEAVELMVRTITEGSPNFPLEWGSTGSYCRVETQEKEFLYVKNKLKVREWVESCRPEGEELGVAVFGVKSEGFLGNDYLKTAFRELTVPSLFLQGTHPYESILLSANTDVLFSVLPDAIDFTRTVGGKLYVLLVTKPGPMEDEEERKLKEELKSFVKRAKRTGLPEVTLVFREGNPVRETVKLAREGFNALIVGYTVGKTGSLLFPYAPYLIAKSSPVTLLLIPAS